VLNQKETRKKVILLNKKLLFLFLISLLVFSAPASADELPDGELPPGTELPDQQATNVFNPELVVMPPVDTIIPFKSAENSKEIILIWTIRNFGEVPMKITQASVTGCGEGFSCSILNTIEEIPIVSRASGLEAGSERLYAIVRVTATRPLGIPKAAEIGLRFSYSEDSDLFEAAGDVFIEPKTFPSERQDKNMHISVTSVLFEEQLFRVELLKEGSYEGYCVGANGAIGSTGEEALPNILLNWSWQGIPFDLCDKNMSKKPVYCDATQFSISLAKKLELIERLDPQDSAQASEISNLTQFHSYIIADSFTGDFQQDFASYFIEDFAQAPDYFRNYWHKYFENPERLVFNSQQLEAGIYKISIDFDFEQSNWDFFDSAGEPIATINISFEKQSNPFPDSIFYHIPFNGSVGLSSENGRQGYGIGYSGETITISEIESGQLVSSIESSGAKMFATSKVSDFKKTNLENRGNLLSINLPLSSTGSIYLAPSYANPVLLKISEKESRAEAFYHILKNQERIEGLSYGSLWTGVASSFEDCKDFYEASLFRNRQDSPPLAGSCASQSSESLGFRWNSVQPGTLFLETVFYVPDSGSFILSNSCRQTDSVFYSIQDGPADNIMLNYGVAPDSISQVFELVKQEKVCVSTSPESTDFWWNEQEVLKAFDSVKKTEIPFSCE